MDVYIGERVNCLILVQVLCSSVMNMQQSSTFSLRETRTVEINNLKRRQILLSLPKSPFQSSISMQGTLNSGVKNSKMFNEILKKPLNMDNSIHYLLWCAMHEETSLQEHSLESWASVCTDSTQHRARKLGLGSHAVGGQRKQKHTLTH